MSRVWRCVYWVCLGIPSAALLILIAAGNYAPCAIGPYGYDCPPEIGLFVLVAMAIGFVGVFTIIPFTVIAVIWGVFAVTIWHAGRKTHNKDGQAK
jgi:hypothetical protein